MRKGYAGQCFFKVGKVWSRNMSQGLVVESAVCLIEVGYSGRKARSVETCSCALSEG